MAIQWPLSVSPVDSVCETAKFLSSSGVTDIAFAGPHTLAKEILHVTHTSGLSKG